MKPRDLWQTGWAVLRARWYLRRATKLGQRVRLWGRPSVRNYGTLLVGDRVQLVSTLAPIELVAGENGTLALGEGVYINYGCSISAQQLVRIGAFSNIGPHVTMMDNDFHRLEPERRQERPESQPIMLEENVWVGARAIILRGVTIGAGSVVAAGSVVTRDVPPRMLVGGVPAKILKSL